MPTNFQYVNTDDKNPIIVQHLWNANIDLCHIDHYLIWH